MSFAEGTPTVTVMLGGIPYTLGWTWAAKRRVREQLKSRGTDPQTAHEEEYLTTIVWAAMDKEQRESITVEGVEELINDRNQSAVTRQIRALILESEPPPSEPESDPNGRPRAPTMDQDARGESKSRMSGLSGFSTSA